MRRALAVTGLAVLMCAAMDAQSSQLFYSFCISDTVPQRTAIPHQTTYYSDIFPVLNAERKAVERDFIDHLLKTYGSAISAKQWVLCSVNSTRDQATTQKVLDQALAGRKSRHPIIHTNWAYVDAAAMAASKAPSPASAAPVAQTSTPQSTPANSPKQGVRASAPNTVPESAPVASSQSTLPSQSKPVRDPAAPSTATLSPPSRDLYASPDPAHKDFPYWDDKDYLFPGAVQKLYSDSFLSFPDDLRSRKYVQGIMTGVADACDMDSGTSAVDQLRYGARAVSFGLKVIPASAEAAEDAKTFAILRGCEAADLMRQHAFLIAGHRGSSQDNPSDEKAFLSFASSKEVARLGVGSVAEVMKAPTIDERTPLAGHYIRNPLSFAGDITDRQRGGAVQQHMYQLDSDGYHVVSCQYGETSGVTYDFWIPKLPPDLDSMLSANPELGLWNVPKVALPACPANKALAKQIRQQYWIGKR